MDIAFATKFLGALFSIMNPFSNLPLFRAMTVEKTVAAQRGLAIKILVYTSVMCIIISLAGGYIIGFFGVTINSFRVAGGLVLLGIALRSEEHTSELQSLMRISYAVFCLKTQKNITIKMLSTTNDRTITHINTSTLLKKITTQNTI